MDKQRLVIVGIGAAIAVVVGLGYLFGIQPQLGAASAASAQAASIAASNRTSQAALDKLERDYANRGEFSGRLAELQRSVPSTPSLDSLLADIRGLAVSTGTTISQFDPGEAVSYVPPAAPAAAAAPSPAASGSSGATPAPTPTAAAPAAPQAPKTTTNPLINAGNFVAIPVKIGVKGTTDGAIAFLGGLQHGDRLVLVTGFSGGEEQSEGPAGANAGATPGGASYSIDALVYVLAPAVAPTPSPAPSAAPSTTPAPTPTPTTSATPAK